MCWEKCYGSGGSGRLNNSKLFQKNSFNLSIKLPSYIFRLQIEGLSCGRDDTEFYRFIKKTLFASACVSKTNGYYNSDY
ncbi:hypothetical protein ACS0TY_013782 [Phlomoides rotata]